MRVLTGPQRERSDEERNLRDMARIACVRAEVEACICRIANIEPLEYPASRWHPDDLRAPLRGTLLDLATETQRITENPFPVDEIMLFEEPSYE